MTGSRKPAVPAASLVSSAAAADDIVQIKVWMLGISPMVWRQVLVPASFTLRELNGVVQVAMGWEAIHLYQFSLQAVRYGSSELSAASPEITLAALRLRKRKSISLRVRFEYPLAPRDSHRRTVAQQPKMSYPACIGGNGACPHEDCHDPAGFMDGSTRGGSWEALEDLGTMDEIIRPIVLACQPEILDDGATRWRLENALDRTRARERAKGEPFLRRDIDKRLRCG